MEDFVNWAMLSDWVTFVAIIYGITQFTKELKLIKKIPTKYWSFLVSFILIISSNIKSGTFQFYDIILYLISGILASMNANGIHDFCPRRVKEEDK